jgi:hypothetical protein
MAMTVTSEDVLFGPPSSLTFGAVELGASEDPAKLSIKVTRFAPKFQGASSPIAGLSRIVEIVASLTVKLNELSLAKLQWLLQNTTVVVGTAATTGGGCTGTLYADVAAGATNIKVTSVTSLAEGDYIKIGDAGETEVHKVAVGGVGTINAGTGVTLTTPLVFTHDAGDAYVEVDNAGTTIITQRVGIISAAQHKSLIMTALGPDGLPCVFTLTNALNTADVDCTFGESETAGSPVTFTGFASKTDPTLAPYSIERLTP